MYNIVYVIDKNIEKIYHSMKSISFNTKSKLTFHIITTKNFNEDFLYIKKKDKIKKIIFNYKLEDTSISHISSYCFVKLKTPYIIKKNTYLYVDYDVYSLNYDIKNIFINNKKKIHMNTENLEFNTGVILVNDNKYLLKKANKNKDLIKFYFDKKKRESINYHDQLFLNEILINKLNLLDIHCFHSNLINFLINHKNINNFMILPPKALIHTNFDNKMWNKNDKLFFLFQKIKEQYKEQL